MAVQIKEAIRREEVAHNQASRKEGVGRKVEVNRIHVAIHKVEVSHAFMVGITNNPVANIHTVVAIPNILPWGTTDRD